MDIVSHYIWVVSFIHSDIFSVEWLSCQLSHSNWRLG